MNKKQPMPEIKTATSVSTHAKQKLPPITASLMGIAKGELFSAKKSDAMRVDEGDGVALVYVFSENPFHGYLKVGIAVHGESDKTIKDWPKYQAIQKEKGWPVTIIRRITNLQTGNPRDIVPLAYFQFVDKKAAKKAESVIHNQFAKKRVAYGVNKKKSEWMGKMTRQEVDECIEALKAMCISGKHEILLAKLEGDA